MQNRRQESIFLEKPPKIILFLAKASKLIIRKNYALCYNIKTLMACPEGKPLDKEQEDLVAIDF